LKGEELGGADDSEGYFDPVTGEKISKNAFKKLQKGDAEVWNLLPSQPHSSGNDYLRLRLDQYHFTTPSERSSTGNWWRITPGPVLLVLPPETSR
jgi:hypothetical protein